MFSGFPVGRSGKDVIPLDHDVPLTTARCLSLPRSCPLSLGLSLGAPYSLSKTRSCRRRQDWTVLAASSTRRGCISADGGSSRGSRESHMAAEQGTEGRRPRTQLRLLSATLPSHRTSLDSVPPRHGIQSRTQACTYRRPASAIARLTHGRGAQLTKEYMTMQRDPPPFIWAVPEENNILTCEYATLLGRHPAYRRHVGNYIIVRAGSLVVCIQRAQVAASWCPARTSRLPLRWWRIPRCPLVPV